LPEAKAELLKVTEIINARKIEQIAIFFMVHFPFLPKPSTGGLMFTHHHKYAHPPQSHCKD